MTEEDYFDRGKKAFDRSDWVEVIEAFSKVIELNPSDAAAYNRRGFALRNLGRHHEAIADFDQAIEHDPKNATAYSNKGSALGKLGRHHEAIADFDQAIEHDPKNATAYNNRGNAKINLGRYEEAIVDCAKAIALDPKMAAAYNNRGNAKTNLGRYEEAIADFDQAIERDSNSAIAYNNRGSTKISLGRHEDAIADFDQAIERDKNYAMAYYKRGLLKRKLEQEAEALKDFKKANEIDPTVISEEQAAALQKDAQKNKQKTEEVEGFQKIFEDIRKDHDDTRKRWFWASLFMVGLTLSMLIALPTIDRCLGLGLTNWEYNFHAIYIFLALTTGFVTRQYTNAKRLMLEETNRLAMAKLFEKIHNSDIAKNKEYHLFMPGLIQSIVYSTRKDGNAAKGGSTAMEEVLNRLKDK